MPLTLNDNQVAKTDWIWQFQWSDEETGDPIDFSGAYIEINVKDFDGCLRIQSSTDNGNISIIDIGVVQLAIPNSQTDLCSGTYKIGGFYTLSGLTLPLIDGTIAVERL